MLTVIKVDDKIVVCDAGGGTVVGHCCTQGRVPYFRVLPKHRISLATKLKARSHLSSKNVSRAKVREKTLN